MKKKLNVRILKQIEIIWSKDKFSENLTQFYGINLPDNSFKEKHCGNAPFTLVIIEDNNPKYGIRMTSKGSKSVNMKMFDLKMKYRKITGGGHKIHGTNSMIEAQHDITLLLGITLEDLKKKSIFENNVISIHKDIEGFKGWDDLNHLFRVLNNTINYVVLRNFESFGQEEIKGDIDILTSSPKDLQIILKAKKIHRNNRRTAYTIKINNKNVFIDIRYLNDGYYDTNWQLDMLQNRYLCNDGYYILDSQNYFYSLLYHAMLHKSSFSLLYKERLEGMV